MLTRLARALRHLLGRDGDQHCGPSSATATAETPPLTPSTPPVAPAQAGSQSGAPRPASLGAAAGDLAVGGPVRDGPANATAAGAASAASAAAAAAPSPRRRPRNIPIKQLSERDRRRVLRHFLSLEDSDRLLRFGTKLPDEQITAYVNRMDFRRDTIYGVYNRVFKLVAVAHLAFAPKDEVPGKFDTDKPMIAEFGVSVLKQARGLGIGSRLFERAAVHCRNHDVDVLYMHYLTSNRPMMHIAKKAGMEVQREYGEADAYLKLLPPSPASVLQEALHEQFAMFDYTFKAQRRYAAKLFESRKPK